MLITIDEFLNSGLPVSEDIRIATVENAIKTAEIFWLKNLISDENYIDLIENPETELNYTLLEGGSVTSPRGTKYVAGIKAALHHYVFALILNDNLRATRYGSVEKDSEYSKLADAQDIEIIAREHVEIAESFVDDLLEFFDTNCLKCRQDVFNKLLY